MKFLSLQPFVPSGGNYEASKQLFQLLGFNLLFDNGDLAGFEQGDCKFMLQKFDVKSFAENFMLSVEVSDAEEFRSSVLDKKLPEKFGIHIGKITQQPYGKEVNMIDMAGVCWHFVEP